MQQPPLRPLHPDTSLNTVKLQQLDRLPTDELLRSLAPGQKNCLMARPDGTLLEGHHRVHTGITTVVSLLTPDEDEALGLEREKQRSLDVGLSFRSLPIVDRSVPASTGDAARLIEELDSDLSRGEQLVVHCRQGVGRSGLIASALLVARGVQAEGAMKQVSRARQVTVPETLRLTLPGKVVRR